MVCGHLVELAQPDAYSDAWKKWTYDSLPMIPEHWQHEVKKDTVAQYRVLKELMHDTRVDSVVCATDAGREGELIMRYVLEYLGYHKETKRLWISSMTEKSIREGFDSLKSSKEFDNLYRAAKARRESDWVVGMNASLSLSMAAGKSNYSLGRVQNTGTWHGLPSISGQQGFYSQTLLSATATDNESRERTRLNLYREI